MRKLLLLLLMFVSVQMYAQKDIVYIWKNCGNDSMSTMKSRLYVFEPADSLRTDVSAIICPGGSYHHLGINKEGYEIAKMLNSKGITAFVLRYRVSSHGYHYPAMMEDIQRSIQLVRQNADKYKIDSGKLGLIGFSAGGHLVVWAAENYDNDCLKKININNTQNLCPYFVAVVYPVISMQDDIAHVKSRKNLFNNNIDNKLKDVMSLELHVTSEMPPFFIVACKDDQKVNCLNSVRLNDALKKKGINSVLQLYDKGGHGFGIRRKLGGDAALWYVNFLDWLNKDVLKTID